MSHHAIILGPCPQIFAFTTEFTTILLCAGVFGIVSGLGAASAAAMQADVLPQDSDNASRDMQMINITPGILPGIVLPSLIGSLMSSSYGNSKGAYRNLFLSAAGIYTVAVALLCTIRFDTTSKPPERVTGKQPGPAALMCDRMCFRNAPSKVAVQ